MVGSAQRGAVALGSRRSSAMHRPPIRSFYQRQLPHTCISFTSEPGKSLFRSALDSGHLESFFPLSSQLVTQHDPSFCGLATLCTVLNALGVDPKRVWKHPWRWYEQDMLDCCRPLDSIRKNGITLSEFNCLARCNGLEVTSRSPSSSSLTLDEDQDRIGLDEFRAKVLQTTESPSQFMIVSFSRSVLGQTGSGHFSPIAGYSIEEDRVLVLDVARFKYPSYWVRLPDLYQAMKPIDPITSLPRGYSILSYSRLLDHQNQPSSMTKIVHNKSSWSILIRKIPEQSTISDQSNSDLKMLLKSLEDLDDNELGIEIRSDKHSSSIDSLQEQVLEIQSQFEIESTVSTVRILFGLSLLKPDSQIKQIVLSDPRFENIKKEIQFLEIQSSALSQCCGEELKADQSCCCHPSTINSKTIDLSKR